MDNVFVIGDVHGNLDRLEALLKQEGLLGPCEGCGGTALVPEHCGRAAHENVCDCAAKCGECDGGFVRLRKDVMVVQLGDLGHFGKGGSPTGDVLCYKAASEGWVDVVLWGNHDRALVDSNHAFTGYLRNREVEHYIKLLHSEGRLQLAFQAHGFLITHAGLAQAFKDQRVPDEYKTDPQAFVDWLNDEDEKFIEGADVEYDPNAFATRDAIGRKRGGNSPVGGILWRDIDEKLFMGFRQIFGHSADTRKHQVRYCNRGEFTRREEVAAGWPVVSYCIDVGGKPGRPNQNGYNPNCLAGIWLPSEKVVRVDL